MVRLFEFLRYLSSTLARFNAIPTFMRFYEYLAAKADANWWVLYEETGGGSVPYWGGSKGSENFWVARQGLGAPINEWRWKGVLHDAIKLEQLNSCQFNSEQAERERGVQFWNADKAKKSQFDVIWAPKSKENDDCGVMSPLKIPILALSVF